jgi:hypothetical protein
MLNIEQLRELIIDQLENITDADLLDLVYKLLLAEG